MKPFKGKTLYFSSILPHIRTIYCILYKSKFIIIIIIKALLIYFLESFNFCYSHCTKCIKIELIFYYFIKTLHARTAKLVERIWFFSYSVSGGFVFRRHGKIAPKFSSIFKTNFHLKITKNWQFSTIFYWFHKHRLTSILSNF